MDLKGQWVRDPIKSSGNQVEICSKYEHNLQILLINCRKNVILIFLMQIEFFAIYGYIWNSYTLAKIGRVASNLISCLSNRNRANKEGWKLLFTVNMVESVILRVKFKIERRENKT